MPCLEAGASGLGCVGLAFTCWAAADALLAEPYQLDSFAFLGQYHVGFGRMLWRPLGFVVTLELLPAIGDHFLGLRLRLFPAFAYAIACACFGDLPALISRRMFSEITSWLLPFFNGTVSSTQLI